VGSEEATLGRVLEHLVGVAEVLAAPRGLDVPAGSPTIHDPAAPEDRIEAHDVVLAVGVRPGDHALDTLLRTAGAAQATAVVVKTAEGLPPHVTAVAADAGIAVVAVPHEITWSQVHRLLATALVGASAAEGTAPIGDLFALANAVSAMVGGATTIEDTRSRVLAYSNDGGEIDEPRRRTILGRAVPPEWVERLTERGVFKQLWSSHDVVHVDGLVDDDDIDLKPRLAIAVRAGDEVLGSIWVAETTTPFDARAEQALREAAEVAALHIVRSRAGEDLARRVRGEQVRAILEGRGPIDVLADRLGADAGGRFVVLAFELCTGDDSALVAQRERALDFVSIYCEAYRRKAASVAVASTIYTLLPGPDDGDTGGLHRMARELVDRARESTKLILHAGIGSVVTGLDAVRRSRADADQVLRVLTSERTVASIDEVRAETMLLELGDVVRERPHLLVGDVDAVLAHDAHHGTVYAASLRTYLDAFGDVPTAAARLGVHPNTLRYRLRRIGELTGIDLSDPQQRLAAELQLRFR